MWPRPSLLLSRRAVLAACVLAVGIACSVSVFALMRAALRPSVQFASAERVADVRLVSVNAPPGSLGTGIPADLAAELRRQSRTIVDLRLFSGDYPVLKTPEESTHLPGCRIEPGLLELLGVNAARGRLFELADARVVTSVVLISDRLWRTRFAGNPNVVGTTMVLDGIDHTVVGVMPATFHFPLVAPGMKERQIWRPFDVRAVEASPALRRQPYSAVARLLPSVSAHDAQRELGRIAGGVLGAGNQTRVLLTPLEYPATRRIRQPLLMLQALTLFLLLMTFIHASTVAVATCSERRQDTLIEVALGASVRRLFVETFLRYWCVGLTGLVLGLGLAAVMMPLFRASTPAVLPPYAEIRLQLPVAMISAAVIAAVAAVFALVPALYVAYSRDSMNWAGRWPSGVRSRAPIRGFVTVATIQLALAVSLLFNAGLLLRAVHELLTVDRGFDPAQVAMAEVSVLPAPYSTDALRQLTRQLLSVGAVIPGVDSVAVASGVPFAADRFERVLCRAGELERVIDDVGVSAVSPEYFRTLRIPSRRVIGEFDEKRNGARAVMVNEAFVRRLPRGAPLESVTVALGDESRRIVGVVGDTRLFARATEASPQVFVPIDSAPSALMRVLVRFSPGMPINLHNVRSAIRRVAGDVPVDRVTSLRSLLEEAVGLERFMASVGILLAATAALLACFGLYAAFTYKGIVRRHECAVRIALGATQWDLLVSASRRVGAMGLIGLIGGIAVGLGLATLIAAQLFQVGRTDLSVLGAVGMFTLGASVLAVASEMYVFHSVDVGRFLRRE